MTFKTRMTPKTFILLAAGAAALALPAAAQAQSWRGYEQPSYGQRYEGGPSYGGQSYGGRYYGGQAYGGVGDYGRRDWDDRGGFAGYPEFRGLEQHIRREIDAGVRNGSLDRDEARELSLELRRLQWQERREFGEHGWRLPEDDRYRLRSQLQRLDARVDHEMDEG